MDTSQCFRKSFFVIVLFSISTFSLADWDVQKVYVRKVDHFFTGSVVTRVIYEVVSGSSKENFSCAQNDTEIVGLPNHYQASHWTGGTNSFHQTIVGQLLAAQAQNIPVDLFFESSGCNATASYGYGGLGRRMYGVSVSSD